MILPTYPITSSAQPLTIAIVKPRKRLDRTAWTRKRDVDRPKMARKRLLAASDGRYAQYEGHVSSVQCSRKFLSVLWLRSISAYAIDAILGTKSLDVATEKLLGNFENI